MFEQIVTSVINELGATGILVIGLYFLLYRPLKTMATHLHTINHEIGEIIQLLTYDQKKP